MRLDATTLTHTQYKELLEALLQLSALQDGQRRKMVVNGLPDDVRNAIKHHDDVLSHVKSIWDTSSYYEETNELLKAIEILEGNSPPFAHLKHIVHELRDFVERTDKFYQRYDMLAAIIKKAAGYEDAVARWLNHVRPLLGNLEGDIDMSLRDLLLQLGDMQPTTGFPLFTFVAGVVGDVVVDPARKTACTVLDSVATDRGMTSEDMKQLRAAVETTRTQMGKLIVSMDIPPDLPAPPSTLTAKLDVEISHRIAALWVLLHNIFTYTQLHTAKGSVYGKAEYHPRVGKLGDFDPLFPEFQDKSLFSLLWDLRESVSDPEQEKLASALQSAEQLPGFFKKLTMLAPVGQEDSKWQIDRESVKAYENVLKGFDIGRWKFQLNRMS